MIAAALSGDELRALYRELILEHARHPRHFGALSDATHEAHGVNPLCGDKLRLYLQIENDEISQASFEGTGCAISVASASLLTETVTGMTNTDALRFCTALVGRLRGESDTAASKTFDFGKLRALEGVRDFPSRVKCATLAWHALASAIRRDEAPASTE